MPLQFIPLDLSRYDKPRVGAGIPQPRTAISEALTPRARGAMAMGGMPAGEGFMERERRLQEEEDRRKHELKLMDKQMEMVKLQAGLKEDAAKGITPITAGQALGRAPAEPTAPALTKENMPKTAMEMWKFISTLEPESQKYFIQQLKEKELGTGGYVEAEGKRIEMPGSLGMYGYLVDQGLIDPATDTVIEKKPEEMKGRFAVNTKTGEIYNTTTGEVVVKSEDVPTKWGEVYTEVLAEGLKHIKEMMDASWMQTMDTDEMNKHIQTKKTEYRDWIAGRLFSRGMTDKDEINRLADLAIGSYNWKKHLDEAKAREEGTAPPTPSPTETNRGLPLNEEVVSSLKQLFKDNPGELDIIEQYKDEYGEVNVNKALEKEVKPTPIIPPPKPPPVKGKKVGRWDVLMETIRERR